MARVPMSITWLRGWSLVRVSGPLNSSTARYFGRVLSAAVTFSSVPVSERRGQDLPSGYQSAH